MVLTSAGAVAVFLLTILAGVLTNMITTDVEERAHGWAQRLVNRAVRCLPAELRQRYNEEWSADLVEQPSPLSQLLFSTGLIVAARRINFSERRRTALPTLTFRNRVWKRLLDLAIAAPILILMLPTFVIVGAAIKLDSAGPIFFRQTRVGYRNRLFPVYKFRSMLMESDAVSAGRDDARITRIGRFIRATSIDEVPQLLNVLRGDMSIVGPRPHALNAIVASDELNGSPEAIKLHSVKPGLTGLRQSDITLDRKAACPALAAQVAIRKEYIQGWSLWRDLKVIALSIKFAICGDRF